MPLLPYYVVHAFCESVTSTSSPLLSAAFVCFFLAAIKKTESFYAFTIFLFENSCFYAIFHNKRI